MKLRRIDGWRRIAVVLSQDTAAWTTFLDLLGDVSSSRSFSGVRLLLVVSSTETGLYQHLQRELASVSGVRVIPERRRGERRRAQKSLPDERRRAERRVRRGESSALGYWTIRFGR
jgi:hypothetical protein